MPDIIATLAPAVSAGLFGIATAVLGWRIGRRKQAADIRLSDAQADGAEAQAVKMRADADLLAATGSKALWELISSLRDEVNRLHAEIEDLKRQAFEQESAWALRVSELKLQNKIMATNVADLRKQLTEMNDQMRRNQQPNRDRIDGKALYDAYDVIDIAEKDG